MKKKYELRIHGRLLNSKLLGSECSAPPWLALLKRRWKLNGKSSSPQVQVLELLYFVLSLAQAPFAAALFVYVCFGVTSVLQWVAFISLVSLLRFCAYCVCKVRACILTGNVRCYLAHVKNYHKPYADIEFSNGRIEKRLFVYTSDKRPINPGDEVYVCTIEDQGLQFCEVRPVSVGKVPSWKSKKKKKV